MCHWTLRIWQCGESYFTKCSPCSFDRAAHGPDSLLNPLHPSITPFGVSLPAKPPVVASSASHPKPESSQPPIDSGAFTGRNRPDLPKGNSRSSGKKPSKDKVKNGSTQTKTGDAIENAGSNNPTAQHGEASSDVFAAGNIHGGSAGRSSEALQPQAYPYRAPTASPFPLQAAVDNGGPPAQPTSWKCGVFEVVLIRREATICPACARSPKRARLPAYARGIYAQS